MDYQSNYLSELTSYIKKNLKKGYTQESLKWALIEQGNSKREVEKAFQKVNEELAREAPILKTRPSIKYEIVEPENVVLKESGTEKLIRFIKKIF